DEQKRVIAGTFGDLRVIDLYVVNGQDIGTDKYDYKLRWLEAVHAWIAEELQRHPKLIVMGDFNIAPDARDVHDPEVWNDNHVLTSTAERGALNKLLQLGLHDGFRLHNDEAGTFSWWDYRAAGFRRNLGLRIDLTLVSDALKGSAVASGIDREPRTWERPSDHAPGWVHIG
ncbi:exodeoxyribonuclease III, partial [Pantoea endophytica]